MARDTIFIHKTILGEKPELDEKKHEYLFQSLGYLDFVATILCILFLIDSSNKLKSILLKQFSWWSLTIERDYTENSFPKIYLSILKDILGRNWKKELQKKVKVPIRYSFEKNLDESLHREVPTETYEFKGKKLVWFWGSFFQPKELEEFENELKKVKSTIKDDVEKFFEKNNKKINEIHNMEYVANEFRESDKNSIEDCVIEKFNNILSAVENVRQDNQKGIFSLLSFDIAS